MFQLVYFGSGRYLCVCVFYLRSVGAKAVLKWLLCRITNDRRALLLLLCVCPRIFSRPADRPRVKKHILTWNIDMKHGTNRLVLSSFCVLPFEVVVVVVVGLLNQWPPNMIYPGTLGLSSFSLGSWFLFLLLLKFPFPIRWNIWIWFTAVVVWFRCCCCCCREEERLGRAQPNPARGHVGLSVFV